MTWSFSRANSYATCPWGWKLQYLDHVPQEDSAFGEWGSLCHSVFEDYAKGKLAVYELGQAYDERYLDYVQHDFPPSRGTPLGESYYQRGKEIFDSFEGFPPFWEILGVELKVEWEIHGYRFIGFIDLLARDKETGELLVIDHKSKGQFKSEEEQRHYAHQLYLYAGWVHEHYGAYPSYLIFNMFRAGHMVTIPFNNADMAEAVKWFTDTVQRIYADVDFWDKITLQYDEQGKSLSEYKYNDFFCKYLCGSRYRCSQSGLTL